MYYQPSKAPQRVRAELAEPIEALIEAESSFGYRTVAELLDMNKNTVQRMQKPLGHYSASPTRRRDAGYSTSQAARHRQYGSGPSRPTLRHLLMTRRSKFADTFTVRRRTYRSSSRIRPDCQMLVRG